MECSKTANIRQRRIGYRGQPRCIMSCGHDTGDSPQYHGLRFCSIPYPAFATDTTCRKSSTPPLRVSAQDDTWGEQAPALRIYRHKNRGKGWLCPKNFFEKGIIYDTRNFWRP